MKKSNVVLCSVVALFLFAGITKAQVFMVVKDGVSTPYPTIEAAVTGAVAGSTVYIPTGVHVIQANPSIAGSVRQNTLLIEKKLALIGAGADEGNLHGTALQGDVVFNTAATSGSSVEGITLGGYLRLSNVSNFLVKRCICHNYVIFTGTGDSNVIKESHILLVAGFNVNLYDPGSSHATPNVKVKVQNCVIGGGSTLREANFTNNVISGGFGNVHYSIISNNIITQSGQHDISINMNTWNNFSFNLLLGDFNPNPSYGNNSIGNNFANVDPDNFIDRETYQLKPTSPYKNGGSDGTDFGMYGGDGFKGKRIPSNPSVTEFWIGGTTIDGNLPVGVKVEAQDE